MNLTHDAMLVSLRISAWSGRLYDRKASNHVAVHHEASASAGRYNKCLLPKAAFAALTATMSKARSSHYEQTLPWDDQGSRLLTVANYEHYMELLDGLRERMVRERARFIEDYEDSIDQARLDLGKLFRIKDYPSKEALQDMARIVLACALKHHTRRGERDPERWQRASQLVTHGLLRDAGFTLPPDAEAWDGISVEQADDRLPEPDPDDGDGDGENDAPSGGGADGADSAGTPPSPDSGGDDDSGGSDDGAGDDDPQDGDGQETGADAPPSCDPAGTGEVMDAPADSGQGGGGPSPSEVAAEEQAWDEAMHQAASLAKAQGKLPGAVEDTVRGAHVSTVDWRTLLRRYMTDAAKSDYSLSLPNLRFIDSGLYLPSIRSEGIDTIAVIVDTSGALPARTLAAFWAEISEIASELQPERVILLQVDAAVQDAAEYAASDLPDDIAIRGRGGTDFRPGFAWLEEHDIQPGVCLYLTDMLCSSYGRGNLHETASQLARKRRCPLRRTSRRRRAWRPRSPPPRGSPAAISRRCVAVYTGLPGPCPAKCPPSDRPHRSISTCCNPTQT